MTYEEAIKIFDYDKDTGNLIWKEHRSRSCRKGYIVGSISESGYLKTHINKRLYRVHRLVWLWHNGYLPECDIDHVDNDKLNNRIENLREVSRSCNLFNRSPRDRELVTGVYKNKYSFDAKISFKNKSIHLGSFKDLVEAVAHRLAAEEAIGVDFYLETPAKIFINSWRLNAQAHK